LTCNTDEGRDELRKAPGNSYIYVDPEMSEWGNPVRVMSNHTYLNI